jgi:hypothetical protein
MEVYETCKTQLSHYPHHLIRAGMCQQIILNILSFAHALQTHNGWTGNTFGFSSANIPGEKDPPRGEFYASSTFVHFLPKPYSRAMYSHTRAMYSHTKAMYSHTRAMYSHAGAMYSHTRAMYSHTRAMYSHTRAMYSHT